ncbi:unnamed protein product [Gadus morhua 'NCC']
MELDANNTPNTRVDVEEAGFNVLKEEAMAAGRPGQSACLRRLAWHRISKNKSKASNKNTALVDVNTVAVRKGQIIRALCGRAPNPGSASITTPSTVEQKRRLGSDQKGRENGDTTECPWSVRPALGKASAVPHPLRWAAGGTLGEEGTGGDWSCTALLRRSACRHTTRSQAVTTPKSGCGIAFSSAL